MRKSRFTRWISVSVAIIMLVTVWAPPVLAGTGAEGGDKEYIVRYKTQQGLTMSASSLQASSISASTVDSNQDSVLYKVSAVDEQEFISIMQQDPNVEYVEPNLVMEASGIADNEPLYENQYIMEFLGVSRAWEHAASLNNPIKIAVIDSGIDESHPDFVNSVNINVVNDMWDYVNNDDNADDENGHGTHVAGIIAAQINGMGMAGVSAPAPITIYDYKVLDASGQGNSFKIAEAINDAVTNGADIINLSLGGVGESEEITNAVNNAINAKVLVVAAAGNDSADVANFTPANLPGVMTVGSFDMGNLGISDFSNFGEEIELYAPGEIVLGPLPNSTVTSEVYKFDDGEGNSYGYLSGTSMAAPIVTGAAALIIAENSVSYSDLWNRLTQYNQIHNNVPLLNVYNAVAAQKAEKAKFNNLVNDQTVAGNVNIDISLSDIRDGNFMATKVIRDTTTTEIDFAYGFTSNDTGHSFVWDTSSFENGKYDLEVRLYGTDGYLVSTDTIYNITIDNSVSAPNDTPDQSAPPDESAAPIGGGGGGGGGVFLPDEQPFKVTEENINEDLQTENQVVVTISDENWSKGIDFEVEALRELQNSKQPITIKSDKFIMQFDPESLDLNSINQLNANNKDVTVRLNVNFRSEKLDLPSDMRAASDVADITLSILSEGEETLQEITKFNKPVKITFPINAEDLFNVDLLGAYYVDENNRLTYMGGFHSLTTNEYVFETDHFSKFVIAELNKEFSDVPEAHWAHHDIQVMGAHHLVNGVTGDEFQPGAEVTRAQYAAMLARALGLNQGTQEVSAGNNATFNDVSDSEWFAESVQAAATVGIVKGDNKGNFRPNDQITRQEMAVMVSRALAYKGITLSLTDEQLKEKLSSFTDMDRIASWSKESVALAVENGIINGRTDGSFDPASNASRAEATVMLKRLWVLVK